jgi:hypothetical protein
MLLLLPLLLQSSTFALTLGVGFGSQSVTPAGVLLPRRQDKAAMICLVCGAKVDLELGPYRCITDVLSAEQCLLAMQSAMLVAPLA